MHGIQQPDEREALINTCVVDAVRLFLRILLGDVLADARDPSLVLLSCCLSWIIYADQA